MTDRGSRLFLVEVPRGSFVKRESHAGGRVDLISPLPCPFNYGCIPGLMADDGDPQDAVAMGPRLPRGAEVLLPVVGKVLFLDGGARDDKLVLSRAPLTRRQRLALVAFFSSYAGLRSLLGLILGRGPTRYEGLSVVGPPVQR